jgi:hypothetical protein
MQDAESIRGDGRRHLLERWLAASGDGAAGLGLDADAADADSVAAASFVARGASIKWRMLRNRSVRSDGRRSMLERRLAPPGGRAAGRFQQ